MMPTSAVLFCYAQSPSELASVAAAHLLLSDYTPRVRQLTYGSAHAPHLVDAFLFEATASIYPYAQRIAIFSNRCCIVVPVLWNQTHLLYAFSLLSGRSAVLQAPDILFPATRYIPALIYRVPIFSAAFVVANPAMHSLENLVPFQRIKNCDMLLICPVVLDLQQLQLLSAITVPVFPRAISLYPLIHLASGHPER